MSSRPAKYIGVQGQFGLQTWEGVGAGRGGGERERREREKKARVPCSVLASREIF